MAGLTEKDTNKDVNLKVVPVFYFNVFYKLNVCCLWSEAEKRISIARTVKNVVMLAKLIFHPRARDWLSSKSG